MVQIKDLSRSDLARVAVAEMARKDIIELFKKSIPDQLDGLSSVSIAPQIKPNYEGVMPTVLKGVEITLKIDFHFDESPVDMFNRVHNNLETREVSYRSALASEYD